MVLHSLCLRIACALHHLAEFYFGLRSLCLRAACVYRKVSVFFARTGNLV